MSAVNVFAFCMGTSCRAARNNRKLVALENRNWKREPKLVSRFDFFFDPSTLSPSKVCVCSFVRWPMFGKWHKQWIHCWLSSRSWVIENILCAYEKIRLRIRIKLQILCFMYYALSACECAIFASLDIHFYFSGKMASTKNIKTSR